VPVLGHLPQWGSSPLQLLGDGARAGPVFLLRLWRPVIVGYRPEWNRAVLSDLDVFRSRGSLSGLSPYLAAGIVHTDAPQHRPRRRALNQHFSAHAVAGLSDRLAAAAEGHQPSGTFDAVAWSAGIVRHMLNTALFGGALPGPLLRRFLQPLHRGLPAPMLPRPRLFRRIDRAIARVLACGPAGSIAAHLGPAPATAGSRGGPSDAVDELRVALAAGYDTTSHTLALGGLAPGRRARMAPAGGAALLPGRDTAPLSRRLARQPDHQPGHRGGRRPDPGRHAGALLAVSHPPRPQPLGRPAPHPA
jgi:cytochrome P450